MIWKIWLLFPLGGNKQNYQKAASESEKKVQKAAMANIEASKLALLENERDEANAAFEAARVETLASLTTQLDATDRKTADQLRAALVCRSLFRRLSFIIIVIICVCL